jgi:hypothetical protein
VLGHLAKAGGAMTADEVERQVSCNWFHFSCIYVIQFANKQFFRID